MGVPQFYSWLTSRYPLIKTPYDPNKLPVIDQLYLDLNGIIYRCVLDETSSYKALIQGKKFEEIWMNAFNYVNEIIQLIQPREMVFIALDGVAPRAKMNQQRSRRFKSAKKYDELDEALRINGILDKEEHFKNNSISPGTEFMHELNKQLQFFIHRKMLEDDEWKKLKIVFSGSDVPGEGEHKILEFIRRNCQRPDFNPNTTIGLYGADADLIMLALTTHLKYMVIFRETVEWKPKLCSATKRYQSVTNYEFIYINVLREYFAQEYGRLKVKIGERYDIERIIDDFIFLCFFIGNDFLPRVFCMDIKKGTFDLLIDVFKKTEESLDGYINNKGSISWKRAVVLFQNIASLELDLMKEKLQGQKQNDKQTREYDDEDYDLRMDIQENLKENKELEKIYKEEVDVMQALEKKQEIEDIIKNFELTTLENFDLEAINANQKVLDGIMPSDNTVSRSGGGGTGLSVNVGSDGVGDLTPFENTKILTPRKKKALLTRGSSEGEVELEPKCLDDVIINAPIEDALLTNIYMPEPIIDVNRVQTFLSNNELKKDIKFMQNLIEMYKAKKTDAQRYFYIEKFKLDIDEDPSQLNNILTSYAQGLQFVLSYYYTNVPSWSWYFPYHYSPLISDLSNLMNILNVSNIDNITIDFKPGTPFEPFKQLLLIMPQKSIHLLPQPYRHLISDPTRSLYKFYPEQFEVDPFGAAFESEYIALIPFVDATLLEYEFDSVDKSLLKPEELDRNKHNHNILIWWDDNQPETIIKPTVPFFKEFPIKCNMIMFTFENFKFDPKKILTEPPVGTLPFNQSFPSLELISNKESLMKSVKKNRVLFNKCFLKFNNKVDPKDYQEYLEKTYYFGYPFLMNCRVAAILTKEKFISRRSYKDFLPNIYDTQKCEPNPPRLYIEFSSYYIQEYETMYGIIINPDDPFAIIEEPLMFRKQSNGTLYPYTFYHIVPLFLILPRYGANAIMSKYRAEYKVNMASLEEEFPKNHEVLIANKPNTGCIGNVINWRRDHGFAEVEVYVKKPYKNYYDVTSLISKKYDEHKGYKEIKEVADNLGLSFTTILSILDSVLIKSDKEIDFKNIYAPKFDIGLNFIKKKRHSIVPEFVICHELEYKKSRSFPHILISPETVKLIKEYYANFKGVFIALEKQSQMGKADLLEAKNVFGDKPDHNLEVLKAYIWLLKQKSSALLQANTASKVLPRKGIQELEEFLNAPDSNPLVMKKKERITKRFCYNPNHIIPKYVDLWIPPFFMHKPHWQFIGDRIINLKCNGYNAARFGQSGTVTGILGNVYENGIMDIRVEIVFDEPFIGGTNLGGRCSWGRGAVVNFDEIFNIIRWPKTLYARQNENGVKGWSGNFNQEYIPKFYNLKPDSDEENEEGMQSTKEKVIVNSQNTFNVLSNQSSNKMKIITKTTVTNQTNMNNMGIPAATQLKTESVISKTTEIDLQTHLKETLHIESELSMSETKSTSVTSETTETKSQVGILDLKTKELTKLLNIQAKPNDQSEPLDQSKSFDQPKSFDQSKSFDQPKSFNQPSSFDQTKSINQINPIDQANLMIQGDTNNKIKQFMETIHQNNKKELTQFVETIQKNNMNEMKQELDIFMKKAKDTNDVYQNEEEKKIEDDIMSNPMISNEVKTGTKTMNKGKNEMKSYTIYTKKEETVLDNRTSEAMQTKAMEIKAVESKLKVPAYLTKKPAEPVNKDIKPTANVEVKAQVGGSENVNVSGEINMSKDGQNFIGDLLNMMVPNSSNLSKQEQGNLNQTESKPSQVSSKKTSNLRVGAADFHMGKKD